MPDQLSTAAVAGSVAFAFIPQTAVAFREIREAQLARGHRFRGIRDAIPLLVPLLTGGLERAVTMAEALESRGFGAPLGAERRRNWTRSAALVLGLASLSASGYFLSVGKVLECGVATGAALVVLGFGVRGNRPVVSRTRYREMVLAGRDLAVMIGAGLTAAITIAVLAFDDPAIRYNPYPTLDAPRVNLLLLTSYALLLVPAFVTPAPTGGDE
jgi:energy-coupling factor transport system permease protein